VLKQASTEKADILNSQFHSVFVQPYSLPPETLQDNPDSANTTPSMPKIDFTTPGIDKLLTGLNPHKAAGPDQIKPIILKNLHLIIAPTLQVIFQKAYTTKQTPAEWRKACITPIFKKGKKEEPANY